MQGERLRANIGSMRIPTGFVLVVGACGSVAVRSPDGGVDVAPDAGPARCVPTAPFGAPVRVDEINTATSEYEARLSSDELTIYFSRSGTSSDIYTATRESRDAVFHPPSPLKFVNTDSSNEYGPSVTADGRTLYLASTRAPSRGVDLWVATRPTLVADFSTPALVANVNFSADDLDPFISADDRILYWWVQDSTGWKIYQATRGNGEFSAGTPVDELNSSGNNAHPVVSADLRTVYFDSDRPGGLGRFDIYVATRTVASDRFGRPTLVTEVNSSAGDSPTWVSDDGCVLYFSSDRSGNSDVYMARRPPP
jgi:Tol biopolymer transport system component